MSFLRDFVENRALTLLLILIACLSVWDDRSNKPDRTP